MNQNMYLLYLVENVCLKKINIKIMNNNNWHKFFVNVKCKKNIKYKKVGIINEELFIN